MRLPRMKTDFQRNRVVFEGFKMFNELPAECFSYLKYFQPQILRFLK